MSMKNVITIRDMKSFFILHHLPIFGIRVVVW
jgi:hypothetical protein